MKLRTIYIVILIFGIYSSLVFGYIITDRNINIIHLAVYGAITSGIYSIILYFSTSKIKVIDFDGSNFQLLVRIVCFSFLFSTLLIFIYSALVGIYPFSFENFTDTFINASIISTLPIIVGMYFYEKRLMIIRYESINFKSNDEETVNEIMVNSDSQNKSLNLDIENLLLIEGADNYCSIYFKEGDNVKKELFRSTLKNLYYQLESVENIYRCHRSYIINKKNISKISGKSQAYKIEFKGVKIKVPVSRSFDILVLQS